MRALRGARTGGRWVPRAAGMVLALALSLVSAHGVHASSATATLATVSGDQTRTTFRLDLSAGVTAEIYTLANPYRVIVDLPDVAFHLPDGTGQTGGGLVRAFRYGLFAESKARIVLDTTGPVRIERAGMVTAEKGIVFTFDLVTTAPEDFGMGTGAERAAESERDAASRNAERPAPPKHAGKPVIMIDPGHGGIDGGAVSASNVLEKNVVLAVARELERQLSAGGRYDVRLTRTTDVFVSLDQRLSISQREDVDLFVSLHADSLSDANGAAGIRGATVYTLSERASDEHARRMAEKENASDAVAGLSGGATPGDDEVKSILFDLMKRESANFSTDFSNVLVRKLKETTLLSRVPQRAAAFKVLKQSHAPSVLVELGYLSHPEDEKLLGSPAWHRRVAASISDAIGTYFSKRTAGSPAP